jgi:hypothetical protein
LRKPCLSVACAQVTNSLCNVFSYALAFHYFIGSPRGSVLKQEYYILFLLTIESGLCCTVMGMPP